MNLVIVPQATVFAGDDAEICQSDVYTNTDAAASEYSSLLWTTSGTGDFVNDTSLHCIYTPSMLDILDGSVELYLTAYANGYCNDVKDTLLLDITPSAMANAGPDDEICSTGTYTLTGSSAANYDLLTWTTSGDGYFVNDHKLHPLYTPGYFQCFCNS